MLCFLLLTVFVGKAKPSALAVSKLVVPTLTPVCVLRHELCHAKWDRKGSDSQVAQLSPTNMWLWCLTARWGALAG